jgi:hypothetical protein
VYGEARHEYMFPWKPKPHCPVGNLDAELGGYAKHTLDVTKECVLERILRDTHPCRNHPERYTQWTEIVQKLAKEY